MRSTGSSTLFKAEVDPATVACVVLEPVQGEGGFIPMPPDFPARLHALCREHGILYVDDEVQSGVGRTGKFWAIEHYDGVEPDLLVSGKSLGGGLPLAAVTGRAELMDAVPAGGLGGTFGGNPLACAAAVAVLDAVSRAGVPRARASLGRRDPGPSRRARRPHAEIGEVRGLGPMLAFELAERTPDRAQAIVAAAFERGPAPARLWHVRQCHPPVGTADDLRRRARRGSGAARGVASPLRDGDGAPPTSGSRGLRKRYGDVAAVDGVDLDIEARRVLHHARPVRIGQDDDAADDRRLRDARRGDDRARRRGRLAAAAVRPAGEHRLPGLRAVPAHDGAGERRVRADGEEGAEGRAAPPRERGARDGAARRLRRPQAGPALGRSASTRRARAGDREPPARCSCSTSRSARST